MPLILPSRVLLDILHVNTTCGGGESHASQIHINKPTWGFMTHNPSIIIKAWNQHCTCNIGSIQRYDILIMRYAQPKREKHEHHLAHHHHPWWCRWHQKAQHHWCELPTRLLSPTWPMAPEGRNTTTSFVRIHFHKTTACGNECSCVS
jgi:hypothetical protein